TGDTGAGRSDDPSDENKEIREKKSKRSRGGSKRKKSPYLSNMTLISKSWESYKKMPIDHNGPGLSAFNRSKNVDTTTDSSGVKVKVFYSYFIELIVICNPSGQVQLWNIIWTY
ncbi:MAG: hypothetical protein HRU15_13905, partial [Planctomycetes bacterium]|nr:hypothetical protein [Planctomycetota bacterium]